MIESTITIGRPREEVFRYFLALDENVPKTNPDVEYIVSSTPGAVGVGTSFRSRGKALGKVRETTMLFTAIVPNEEIRFEAEVGPMRPICAFTFDDVDGGTRVTLRADPNPVGFFKVMSPIFGVMGRKVWRQRLERAKTALESDPAA